MQRRMLIIKYAPWLVLFIAVVWITWSSHRTMPIEDLETEGFAGNDLHIDDIRRMDQLLELLSNDREHPQKLTAYEEYFAMRGIEPHTA